MSKVAHYLQEHLVGEVMTSTDARRYFATDGSILQLAPALVAYPRNENDVRKACRFAWQLAERNRVNKRELNKKLGLATFEGEIYRSVDTLLEEQPDTIERLERNVTKNNAGYNLLQIKRRDGSFDLTPLFVGSQGTLGVITEAVL